MKKAYYVYILPLIIFCMSTSASNAAQISYTLTFPEAQAHYLEVEMKITGLDQPNLDLKMPVWTPGSYLVREYSKNVEGFSASSAGKALAFLKTRKRYSYTFSDISWSGMLPTRRKRQERAVAASDSFSPY